MAFFRLFSEDMAVKAIGTIRKRSSSLLSTKLIFGLTDLKDERRENTQYKTRGQKNEGNRGQLFCFIIRNNQQKKANDRAIWMREMETKEKSR